MSGRLVGKTAFISGGGGKIGRALALRLARDGANIVLADINSVGIQSVTRAIEDAGGTVRSAVLDLAEVAEIAPIVERTIEEFGAVDILCNVAGVGPKVENERDDSWAQTMFWELDPTTWSYHIRTNLYTCMACCYSVIPHMIERRYGRILNWVTGSVLTGRRGISTYAAAKGAVHAFTKALAKELGEYGITVNDVSFGDPTPEYFAPGGRATTAEDVADVAAFLVSDDARWVSAQSVCASGGQFPR